MPDFVLDANVFIADLIGRKHDNQDVRAKPYLVGMRQRVSSAHVPTLMLVEVCGALARQVGIAVATRGKKRLDAFRSLGTLEVYDLDNPRMERSRRMAIDYRLKGADAVYAALSDELGLDLVTFDEESLTKPLRARGYTRVIVPT